MHKLIFSTILILAQVSFASVTISVGDQVAGAPDKAPMVFGTIVDKDNNGLFVVDNKITGTKQSIDGKDLANRKSCANNVSTSASVLLPGVGNVMVLGIYENGDLLLAMRGMYKRVKASDVTLNRDHAPGINSCGN